MALINRNSLAFKIISVCVVLSITGIIARIFIQNWHKIPLQELRLDYRYLIGSMIFAFVLGLCPILLWKYILSLLNQKTQFLPLWRVGVYSSLARYIPGRIWQYMGRIYWGKKIGLSEHAILVSTLLESIFFLSSAFFVSLFTLNLFLPKAYVIILSIVSLGMIGTLHPKVVETALNILGKKWIKEPIKITFTYPQILLTVFLYSILWIGIGVQSFLFILSFYQIPLSKIFYFTSVNAASWLIGIVSIITPSGIGVREGVFVFVFKSVVPVSIAILCAIITRFYSIISELLIGGLFLLFDKGAWSNFFSMTKKAGSATIVESKISNEPAP